MRGHRILSNNDDFEHHLWCLLVTLLNRDYDIVIINEIFAKVPFLSRMDYAAIGLANAIDPNFSNIENMTNAVL